jgi:hypothetical protein
VAGYDWASLGKKLSEKVDGFDKQVLDRVVNILQGAQIGGVSLDPIAKASSSVKDGLNAIVQQIIEWVIDQLNGLKFPPIVVSMSVVWVKDPDGVVDKVPQTTVCYFTTDGDGKKQSLPLPPKTPANNGAGRHHRRSASEGGQETRPQGTGILGLSGCNGSSPCFCPAGRGQRHFFGLSDPGKYWVALRTEVRVVEVVFKQVSSTNDCHLSVHSEAVGCLSTMDEIRHLGRVEQPQPGRFVSSTSRQLAV